MACESATETAVSPAIRGIVFDVGSTLLYATTPEASVRMRTEMAASLKADLSWTDAIESDFIKTLNERCFFPFFQLKKHVQTGSTLDAGCIGEPSVEVFLEQAIADMHKRGLLPYATMAEAQTHATKKMTSSTVVSDTVTDASSSSHSEEKSIKQKALEAFDWPKIETAKLVEGVAEFLKWATTSCVPPLHCAICSNDWSPHRLYASLDKHAIRGYFDMIIVSAAVDLRKPDVRMVAPILEKWKREYGIRAEECLMIGDKQETDILLAKYSGMRSALACFYDRDDDKWQSRSRVDPSYYRLHYGSYMGPIKEMLASQQIDLAEYSAAEVCVKDYASFPSVLSEVRLKPFAFRRVKVGVLMPDKKWGKLTKRGFFSLTEYRHDLVIERIDLSEDCTVESLRAAGPWDILLVKLNAWIVAKRYDANCRKVVDVWEEYCRLHTFSQFDLRDSKKSFDSTSMHLTYFLGGNPQEIERHLDRGNVIDCVNAARIRVKMPAKMLKREEMDDATADGLRLDGGSVEVAVRFPQTILVTGHELAAMKATPSELSATLKRVLKMRFPLYAKPNESGSSLVSLEERHSQFGHHLWVVPATDTLLRGDVLDAGYDWVLQEYVDHGAVCHKCFVLGPHVFASVNDSTPDFGKKKAADGSEDSSALRVDSKKVSKRKLSDQSLATALASFYVEVAKRVMAATDTDCFGLDFIFEKKTGLPFIVDWNFFPSYKSVENLTSVFWQYALYKQREFKRSAKGLLDSVPSTD